MWRLRITRCCSGSAAGRTAVRRSSSCATPSESARWRPPNSRPGLAARVAPDDIVQSVFRTFFRRAAKGQYDVPEGEEIWKLLLVIALHKIRDAGDYHRAARRDVRQTAGGAAYERALNSTHGRDEGAMAVLRLVIEEVLDALPPGHRPIVERRIEGYEVAEIAEQLRRSKRTVERVLQEFRQRLDAQIREGD